MPVLNAADTAPEFSVAGRTPRPASPLPKPRGAHRWTVLAVKSNMERALATDLLRRRITYFLPMTGGEARSGGRHLPVMRPLFDGYMFVYCDAVTLYTRVLVGEPRRRIFDHIEPPAGGQPKLYQELQTLRAVKAYYEAIDVKRYVPGAKCEFLQPECLRGVQTTIGEVKQHNGTYTVQVPVAMLGASVFEVPYDHLRIL